MSDTFETIRSIRPAVYDILVEVCGAYDADEHSRSDFYYHWPECVEYRFCGRLGMGGKVWAEQFDHAPWVSCYSEDETPERAEMIRVANERLAALYENARDAVAV